MRITSSADFGYKYLNRRKIDSTIDDLLAASKSGDKAQVLEAAKALTQVVKEVRLLTEVCVLCFSVLCTSPQVEEKELDDETTLKQDTRVRFPSVCFCCFDGLWVVE